ncbi:MAG: CPBP family intramembrane metalloprotease [Actinomycetota bacterium]|nr:CPBP family intramembrane metalloprotease [Actinomycetota bacterium]
MTRPAEGIVEPAQGELGWREVFAVANPARVAGVVLAVAAATFGWATVLLVVFDARSWWGQSLAGMAAAFGVVFLAVYALAARATTEQARLAAFLATGWAAVSLVSWLPRQGPDAWPHLAQLAWWAGWVIAIYVSVPIAYARITAQPIRSYGLRLGLFRGEARIFAILLPAIVIGAYVSAGQPRFQQTYPFYRELADGTGTVAGLLTWWLMYAATFVALEFFFRGFLVSAGFRIIRWWAVPAMGAPYCLLHLDKPIPELVTSLFGGMLLGVVAVRTRSILAGVLAHVTLAIGTDAAVLLRR